MVERLLTSDLHSLEQLVLNWPDAVLVYDGDVQRYVVANIAAERLLGYSRDEILTLSPAELSHPDDAREIPEVVARADREGSVRRPWRARRKDGEIIDTEMTLTRTRIEGRTFAQGIFRVVQHGLVSQQPAHGLSADQVAFLDRTGLTVVALDRHGIVTYWNAAAVEQYGLETHEAIGQSVRDMAATDEARAEVESLMSHHESRDEWVSKLMIRPRHTDPYEAMVTGSVIRTADGELNGFLFVSAPLEATTRPSAQRMRRAKVQCAACGREVAGTMRRKYCSEKCRQWAYYHRHLEAQRARSRERHERRRDTTEDSGAPDASAESSPDQSPTISTNGSGQ
jgi:PAS domain S-box-containing protein